jgi:hypothetical protein
MSASKLACFGSSLSPRVVTSLPAYQCAIVVHARGVHRRADGDEAVVAVEVHVAPVVGGPDLRVGGVHVEVGFPFDSLEQVEMRELAGVVHEKLGAAREAPEVVHERRGAIDE